MKRSSPAIRNWRKSSLRRENLCRHTTSQWRWSESGAQTYTLRGPCASHSKDTLRGLHTCASLDQLVVLKLYLPQSIQSVNTKTLEQLLGAISNVSACLHHTFSIIWLNVRTCSSFYWREGVVLGNQFLPLDESRIFNSLIYTVHRTVLGKWLLLIMFIESYSMWSTRVVVQLANCRVADKVNVQSPPAQ